MDYKNDIAKYFSRKRNIGRFLAFVYAFALGFILLVNPFDVKSWTDVKGMSEDEFILTTALVVGIGFFVLLVSRFTMYFLRNKLEITFKTYLVWVFAEIVFVAAFCALFAWLFGETTGGYFKTYFKTIEYTATILLIPYIISWLYTALKAKKDHEEKLDDSAITTDLQHLTTDKRSEMQKTISEAELFTKERLNVVNFCDDKGQLKLSVDIDNLLYVEADDNYVNIYYSNKGKFSKFSLRLTLKSIEDNFADCDLVRCHRSYIVNLRKVKVLRKEKDGLFLDLDFDKSPELPVSKTYSEAIVNLFTKNNLSV